MAILAHISLPTGAPPVVLALLRDFYEAGNATAVVCHGTCALLDVKLAIGELLIEGRQITGFANSEESFADRERDRRETVKAAAPSTRTVANDVASGALQCHEVAARGSHRAEWDDPRLDSGQAATSAARLEALRQSVGASPQGVVSAQQGSNNDCA